MEKLGKKNRECCQKIRRIRLNIKDQMQKDFFKKTNEISRIVKLRTQ